MKDVCVRVIIQERIRIEHPDSTTHAPRSYRAEYQYDGSNRKQLLRINLNDDEALPKTRTPDGLQAQAGKNK